MPADEKSGTALQLALLGRGHTVDGAAKTIATAVPHLDESDVLRVTHDQVDLADGGAKVAGDQLQPVLR